MKELLHWSGPVVTLFGVVIGAYATLLMCRVYHPFTNGGMIRHLFWLAGRLVLGELEEVRSALATASAFAQDNTESKTRTLAGVYVLVFSFFVQTLGASLVLFDLRFSK